MNITLIGYRGVGKSTVGPQLAARLGWECVEVDELIARRAGKSIADIFAQDGEPVFRRLEAELLGELFRGDQLVISAGGGAVLNELTRQTMREAGPVVWLQASTDSIWSRIGRSLFSGSRPALTDQDPRAEVEQLLRQREPFYAEAASLVIPTDNRSVTAIVDEIASLLPPQQEWPE
ncbi:MAG: shikimate kinase [Planctomycetaceae bacterium]